jgi:aspartate-semialdehyde dehydrogenase
MPAPRWARRPPIATLELALRPQLNVAFSACFMFVTIGIGTTTFREQKLDVHRALQASQPAWNVANVRFRVACAPFRKTSSTTRSRRAGTAALHARLNLTERIPVAVLGATGSVGQRFVQLLEGHPWFEVVALGASSRSAGHKYGEQVSWKQATPIPADMADIEISECDPNEAAYRDVRIVFSGLDNQIAGEIETRFAQAGKAVFSNAKNHRMDPDVPILIPPVNASHIEAVRTQAVYRQSGGFIVTNANCSTTAMTIGLAPIWKSPELGIETIVVSTMQAISGAGYPGLSGMDILDNVVPYIGAEEGKMETESLKIYGEYQPTRGFVPAEINVSAMCNRVHVLDGHTEAVSIKVRNRGNRSKEELAQMVIRAIQEYPSTSRDVFGLPSGPERDVVYNQAPDRPQPRLDRNLGRGFTVTVGRVRPCNVLDVKLALCGHNTIVGAAGGSILNAELAVVKKLIASVGVGATEHGAAVRR